MPSRLVLQLQIVPAHYRGHLAHLVGLRLAPNFLPGENLNDTEPGEDTMAAPAADLLEAERF